MLDLSDLPPLAVGNSAGRLVIQLPACLEGSVDRVALVAEDLESTLWEIQATSDQLDVRSFVVGEVPDGFREVVSVGAPSDLRNYIAVVNTSDDTALAPVVDQHLVPGEDTLTLGESMEDFAARSTC